MDARGAELPGRALTDLVLRPARGLPDGLLVPDAELVERFSRSSGPGGQGVNTTDSRVELSWDVARSGALTEAQRARVLDRLAGRLVDGVLVIAASEHRSQLRNREAARARLAGLLADALEPPSPARRPTRPSRAAHRRRVEAKRRRGDLKASRRHPPLE
jgi:ribosome-associated protein